MRERLVNKISLKVMRLNLKQLKNLSVETISGISLGFVHDIVWDTQSNMLVQLLVKKITAPTKKYLINTTQIVKIDETKIVVEDNIISENFAKFAKKIPKGEILSA